MICPVLMALISFSPRRRTPSASEVELVGGAGAAVDAERHGGVGAGVDGELVDGVGAAVDAELVDSVGLDAVATLGSDSVVDGSFRFCNFAKLNGIGFGEISGQ